MKWTDANIWKQSFYTTIICFLSCLAAIIIADIYLLDAHWLLALLVKLITALIISIVLMVIFELMFHNKNFIAAIHHGFRMSLVSVFIIIISEKLVLEFVAPHFLSHPSNIQTITMKGFDQLLLAMTLGFVLSLLYNYYLHLTIRKVSHHTSN